MRPPSPAGATDGTIAPNTLTGMRAAAAPREGFLTAAFAWMFVGLLLSAGSAFFASRPDVLPRIAELWPVLLIGTLVLVVVLSLAIAKLPPLVALAMFFVYALLNGLTLGLVVDAQVGAGNASGVVSAFLGAAAIFAGAALYGAVTKRDLTRLGGILFMGVLGLVVMSLVQIFLFPGATTLSLAIGAIGVVIFTGLTAYDVQRISRGEMAGLNRDSAAVAGALALYLDFINLFLLLLRLFGGSNNR